MSSSLGEVALCSRCLVVLSGTVLCSPELSGPRISLVVVYVHCTGIVEP